MARGDGVQFQNCKYSVPQGGFRGFDFVDEVHLQSKVFSVCHDKSFLSLLCDFSIAQFAQKSRQYAQILRFNFVQNDDKSDACHFAVINSIHKDGTNNLCKITEVVHIGSVSTVFAPKAVHNFL